MFAASKCFSILLEYLEILRNALETHLNTSKSNSKISNWLTNRICLLKKTLSKSRNRTFRRLFNLAIELRFGPIDLTNLQPKKNLKFKNKKLTRNL